MSDIFSAAVSAMNAAQMGLATTEHNIANANTPGYTRQSVVQSATPAQLTGSGFVGTGVNVATIQQAYNQFLTTQVNQQQTISSQLNTQYSQIQQIDNMMSSSTTGITPAVQNFFNAVNTVASNPNSMPSRQTMLSTAQSLASTFQTLSQQLTSIGSSVNNEIASSVSNINSFAQQIATLNNSIVSAQAASGGQPPNDLLDQRNQLVAQLNQQVNVSVVNQGNGNIELTMGNGQVLVMGGQSYNLATVNSSTDPSQTEVAFAGANGKITPFPSNSIQSGNLGGLLAFRSQNLAPAENQLGLVAAGIAGTFNQQNQLGQNLNGAMPSSTNSFFSDPVPLVVNNTSNTGNGTIAATITNYSQLTGSDYSLTYDGNNYTLTRSSDNKIVSTSSTMPIAADGVSISFTNGTPKAGDSYLIRPTANAAANMQVAISDPAQIAAASPVMTNAPTTNTGNATISSGSVDETGTNVLTAATAPGPITFSGSAANSAIFSVDGVPVTVNQDVTVPGNGTGPGTLASAIQAGLTAAGLSSYSVSSVASGGLQITHAGSLAPVAISNANTVATSNGIVNGTGTPGPVFTPANLLPPVTLTYASGTPGTLTGFPANMPVTVTNSGIPTTFAAGTPVTYTDGSTINFGGISFSISGTPANNDSFSISQNTNGATDNRNALLLAGLQTKNTMQGGTTNFIGVYSELVAQVGNQTSQLKVTSTAQTTTLNQTIASQQSVSGVNLDEEAANLLRYQQAYQAAGKAMQIASTLFDTLLSLGK